MRPPHPQQRPRATSHKKRPALNLRKLPITPLEMDDEEFARAVAELQKLAADSVLSPPPWRAMCNGSRGRVGGIFRSIAREVRRSARTQEDRRGQLRTSDTVRALLASWRIFLDFAHESGSITLIEKADLEARGMIAFTSIAEDQDEMLAACDPVLRFFELPRGPALWQSPIPPASPKARRTSPNFGDGGGMTPNCLLPGSHQGDRIGWLEGGASGSLWLAGEARVAEGRVLGLAAALKAVQTRILRVRVRKSRTPRDIKSQLCKDAPGRDWVSPKFLQPN